MSIVFALCYQNEAIQGKRRVIFYVGILKKPVIVFRVPAGTYGFHSVSYTCVKERKLTLTTHFEIVPRSF